MTAGHRPRGIDEWPSSFGSTFTNKVEVALGTENDQVTLSSITAQNLVTLNGGSGVDTYTDGGGNAFNGPPLVLKNIEIID
jgi:hypothetical protein